MIVGSLTRLKQMNPGKDFMNRDRFQAYDRELQAGKDKLREGDFSGARHFLGRAHILGQKYSVTHWESHWWLLCSAWKAKEGWRIRGQMLRLLLAVPSSMFRMAPLGNSGLCDVGLLKTMDPPEDLKDFL